MNLGGRVLNLLIKKDASPLEISTELGVETEKIHEVLRRLKAEGLIVEVDGDDFGSKN